tara:strand:- start:988 stop:1167 length:180 start_codon:yes stop_codon:yes gene_type:complete
MQEKLEILNGALASLGINTTPQMLETIFELFEVVKEKGEEINLKEVREIAIKVQTRYEK